MDKQWCVVAEDQDTEKLESKVEKILELVYVLDGTVMIIGGKYD